ncbi:oxidoreductase [Paramyrothecium foliicola]|nr:oxidoreductase [Paramyrothecium foliicola]
MDYETTLGPQPLPCATTRYVRIRSGGADWDPFDRCTPGGLGYAMAVEFHKRGCHVIATARKAEVLSQLASMGMTAISLDVTSKESVLAAKEEVEKITGGRLDILINNAGRTHTIPAVDFELEDAKFTYDTNVFGPMLMCQTFINQLIAARGLIINISSASSVIPYLFGSVYSSTKAALNQYSRVLRMELKPFNVRVMVAMTGTVRSNITSHGERDLPANSIYQPALDMFERRKNFSQTTMTMDTELFAEKIVTQALKGEGWLGGWIGRTPDWYWLGGMSTIAWVATCLPRTVAEGLVALFFKVPGMASRIQAARAKRD